MIRMLTGRHRLVQIGLTGGFCVVTRPKGARVVRMSVPRMQRLWCVSLWVCGCGGLRRPPGGNLRCNPLQTAGSSGSNPCSHTHILPHNQWGKQNFSTLFSAIIIASIRSAESSHRLCSCPVAGAMFVSRGGQSGRRQPALPGRRTDTRLIRQACCPGSYM